MGLLRLTPRYRSAVNLPSRTKPVFRTPVFRTKGPIARATPRVGVRPPGPRQRPCKRLMTDRGEEVRVRPFMPPVAPYRANASTPSEARPWWPLSFGVHNHETAAVGHEVGDDLGDEGMSFVRTCPSSAEGPRGPARPGPQRPDKQRLAPLWCTASTALPWSPRGRPCTTFCSKNDQNFCSTAVDVRNHVNGVVVVVVGRWLTAHGGSCDLLPAVEDARRQPPGQGPCRSAGGRIAIFGPVLGPVFGNRAFGNRGLVRMRRQAMARRGSPNRCVRSNQGSSRRWSVGVEHLIAVVPQGDAKGQSSGINSGVLQRCPGHCRAQPRVAAQQCPSLMEDDARAPAAHHLHAQDACCQLAVRCFLLPPLVVAPDQCLGRGLPGIAATKRWLVDQVSASVVTDNSASMTRTGRRPPGRGNPGTIRQPAQDRQFHRVGTGPCPDERVRTRFAHVAEEAEAVKGRLAHRTGSGSEDPAVRIRQ